MRAFAKAALLLLVLSLPFAKPGVTLGGLRMVATDVVYLIVVIALAIAIARREARLHWNNGVGILAFYLAAMVVSVLIAGALAAAAPKLASQIYLLSLPLLVDALIDDLDDLKRVFRAWLAGTAICVAVGVATLVLFVVGVDRAAIDFALHGFGTLPPGAYPRLEATFTYPAMLCNFLTVSLVILLLCLHLRWIGRIAGYTLLAAIMATAAFTLTPGLGGIAACAALSTA